MDKSKKVENYVNLTKGFLKLFFLPPYSPKLNPDKLAWNHLKYHGTSKLVMSIKTELVLKVISHLKSLQRKPKIIKSVFKKPSLQYAA